MTADASLTLIFLSGFAGGLTLEIAKAYSVFPTQSFPARFKDWRYWIMTVLVAVAGGGFAVVYGTTSPRLAFMIGLSFPQLLRSLAKTEIRRAEREASQKVEEAEKAVEETPEKARPYWDLSSARLELYFQRNLSQTRLLFWCTISVLLAGFLLICYGVFQAFRGGNIEAAMLTAGSGVLTEFIAGTFLVLFKSTSSQASDFVSALERINAVGMSLQIVDSISEGNVELSNKTRADLAIRILDVFVGEKKKPSPKNTQRAHTA